MTEITKEQRDELRRLADIPAPANYNYVSPHEEELTLRLRRALPALLDAADERDRLRAELAAERSARQSASERAEFLEEDRDKWFAKHETERDKRERAERDRDDWHTNFRALEKAVLGDSSGSAIMAAGGLRERAERAEAELEKYRNG